MTTELERIKILEGKISQVVEYINTLSTENEKLKQQVKELRTDKTKVEEQSKKLVKLDEEIKKYEDEREIIKGKIEAIINQIDQLGI
ncbi:MAG: cell division protein ZapB [Acidobacteriota bacterium]|nr:cell division protein ZapB [Acidobacteriota bacterium]